MAIPLKRNGVIGSVVVALIMITATPAVADVVVPPENPTRAHYCPACCAA